MPSPCDEPRTSPAMPTNSMLAETITSVLTSFPSAGDNYLSSCAQDFCKATRAVLPPSKSVQIWKVKRGKKMKTIKNKILALIGLVVLMAATAVANPVRSLPSGTALEKKVRHE